MRIRIPLVFVLIAAFAAPASASMGGSPPPEPASSPRTEVNAGGMLTPRQQAEQLYGGAYDDIAKAGLDAANGKDKNAQKKYRRALDRASDAAALDSMYFEAWNLAGFAARKLADYPRSLASYARCLGIQPSYAPAREYLGEAYLELGRIREAREQLSWLERLGAADQAKALSQRIVVWQAAHPDSLAPAPAAKPDSASKAPAQGTGG